MREGRTSTLLRRLFQTNDLNRFIESHGPEMELPVFHEYIMELARTIEQVPEQIIRRSGIERSYGHQLFNGTRNPSRDKVIQLAIGFQLNADGTQKLLTIAQKSLLYPRIKRDAAILYCISHQKDIIETQGVLHSLGLTLLGGDND